MAAITVQPDYQKRKRWREYMRERNALLKEKGLCRDCRESPRHRGRIFCKECLTKSSERAKRYRLKHPEKREEWARLKLEDSRKRKKRNRLRGICVQCGCRPAQACRISCGRCLERSAKRSTEYAKIHKVEIKIYHESVRLEVYKAYGGPLCACCGESGLKFLSIDHVDGGGVRQRKRDGVGSGRNFMLWLRQQKFPSGYQVLCMNCNHGRHRNGGICPHKEGR